MVNLKTSVERKELKEKMQKQRDKIILARFEEIRKNHTVSDAVAITANEFNLSPMTIYNIRKRNT